MTGHFEKGAWIEGITIGENADKTFIPLCVDFDPEFSCTKQVDRVARLLGIKALDHDQLNGEMIIKGSSGNWYRILDFFEYLIKRMK
jgi:hypothetical protein